MVLWGDEAEIEACFGPFEDSVSFRSDWCTVCAKHTIDSKIVLDTLDDNPR
jgi:hypothetical protein